MSLPRDGLVQFAKQFACRYMARTKTQEQHRPMFADTDKIIALCYRQFQIHCVVFLGCLKDFLDVVIVL